ncbi:trehalose 6-phosphate phosphatase [Encephalitozoon hellem ATCC 50504]|uniref:Trehalose-6-phosphate synthase n=2 Tax=Encephalitozoon hellem TaxID=27973 RepID=A0A9Q9C8Q0_ENCHE|nr:trehalose 6-phosphate phosphatase [Encephalitozoon hellem ATCC 50504]AFM97697.1 trehalose 6-phosphate phosphatase [Encephalitozoon hellem ATCC 50504]UTX42388.1 trehalose-6-phosphate synthase [Encephalitozoon hellem]|eukprot:XP_003886678.1 trehalose 6-phosphate phosphatase [Encephalitozoon hellem ATCC 50504]
MKIIVAMDELPICASRMGEEETIRKRSSALLKRISHPDKTSKIQIEFSDDNEEKLRLFAKPHFMAPDMLDDREMSFVGVPGFYSSEAFSDEDRKKIQISMGHYRCYPVFKRKGEYSRMIERILKKNTYEFVQKHLDHAAMFEEYRIRNNEYYEKIMEIYEEGDVVWVMDHSLLLLPGMLGGIPVGMSFCAPFSLLFKCIPFWEELFLSILCCKYIEFSESSSAESFNMLVSQKKGFVAGNPEYKSVRVPQTCVGKRGIDKEAILKASSEAKKLERFGNGKIILVPFDSQTHLLGVEAYLSRYEKEITILFLITGALNRDFDEQTEVMRLRKYLEMNYNILSRVFVPTSDSEFVSVLKSCDLCYCSEMADICSLFGIPVIQSNPYDFFEVADEINEKLERGGASEKDSRKVIGKMEWKKRFMTNFLHASGIECDIDAEPKEPRVRASLSMRQKEDVKTNSNKRLSTRKKEDEKKEAIEIDLDNKEDVNAAKIVDDFKKSKVRTLVMDYDGTLTDIVAHPPMAAPTQEIKDLLVRLNKICRVIISTGRSVEDSDRFFPKEIEVFAEHGACYRVDGKWKEGVSFPQKDLAWRVAEFFHLRTPGSDLERKKTGYAFHFRNVSPLIGVKQAKALFELLVRICKDNVKEGNHIVEVRSSKKSRVMGEVEEGFILCAGDDAADEEAFDLCSGYTIKVGNQDTSAAYRIKDPKGFRMLLAKFLE